MDNAGTLMECPEPSAGEIRSCSGIIEPAQVHSKDRIIVPELVDGSLANRFAVQAGQMVLLPSWWVGEYSRPTFTVLEP